MSDDVERDEARPEDVEVSVSDDDADEFSPFADLDDEFGAVSKAQYVVGGDGMPQAVDMTQQTDVPPLSTETLVCLGDYSKFVVRDRWGYIVEEYEPADVQQTPNGMWYVEDGPKRTWQVAPVRPPCAHYVEQWTQYDQNAENKALKRLCAARRNTGGAFLGLSDLGVYACTMREPRDLASEKAMQEFNERKIREGRNRVYLPIQGGVQRPTDADIERRAAQLEATSYITDGRELHHVARIRNMVGEPVLECLYDVMLDGSLRVIRAPQTDPKPLDILAAEFLARTRAQTVKEWRTGGGSNG